ncbi:MFS transporter [Bacillus rubiinfantis]|uniref:MFS transporter n=1 Tax=Bacillus rubiinfantis TaxID=1499680 RepID=UPI0005A62C4A|nr:MFS transporter [Bacillus rubiinfantis]
MNEIGKLRKATYHLWTFTISKLISAFGAQVYSFSISFYILQATGSAGSFAINLLCNILPRALAAPFAGYMADKYSRKMMAILSQLAATVAIAGLLVVHLNSGLSLPAIYTVSCILSLTSMVSGVAFSSSITRLVDDKRIQRAMSLNQMSISFAAVCSPAVGGVLYGTVSIATFLVIYLSASMIAVVLEATMNFNLYSNQESVTPEEKAESMWQSLKAGVKYLKMQPLIMTVIWISLFVNFLFGAYQVGYSYILIEKLAMDSQRFGVTEGAFAAGMLLISIYFSMRKEVKNPLIVAKWGIISMGLILAAMTLPLLATFSQAFIFGYYIILQLGLGGMILFTDTPIMVYLQKQTDNQYKGRLFSILETMALGLKPLAMILYGFLYDVLPAQWIMLVSAALFVSVILVLARPSIIRKVHSEMEHGKTVPLKKVSPTV